MSDIAPALAYIAEGKLYTQTAGSAAKLIESPFVQGILDQWAADPSVPLDTYEAGSWGPKSADQLIASEGRQWHQPIAGG